MIRDVIGLFTGKYEFDKKMDKARHDGHKNTIERAIRDKDVEYLKEALNTRIQDYPDLVVSDHHRRCN